MFLGRSITSKLLIWLTAVAMPFQVGWAADCGCRSARDPAAAIAECPLVPAKCCFKAAAPQPTCCEESPPDRTCCAGGASLAGRETGCQCGPTCRCVDADQSLPQPPATATDNGGSQSAVELAVSPYATICAKVADRTACSLSADFESVFCQPGAQVCVFLCRFTL